jgi:murein DD-endopeptidase MepM/ murein hydrolase activator NlpD
MTFSQRDILTGVIGLSLLLTVACAGAAPVETVQPPALPPVQEQLYTLSGTVYHDYNGDGIKEDGEPGISGVELDLVSKVWPLEAARDTYPWTYNENTDVYEIQLNTDTNGMYNIQIPVGDYILNVNRNNVLGCNDQPFRYINMSKEQCQKITDSVYFSVDGDTVYDVALMQGFLTLPFGPNTKFLGENQFGIESFVDLDNGIGYVRNWKGNTGQTYDRHTGTDFYMEENTPILAAAPGLVIASCLLDPTRGYDVLIQHESPYFKYKNISTEYAHLNRMDVKVGDKVKRGDVIGTSGRIKSISNEFYNGEHLHLTVFLLNSWDSVPYHVDGSYTDPYRNISDKGIQTVGYWTKDNDPQYP